MLKRFLNTMQTILQEIGRARAAAAMARAGLYAESKALMLSK